MCHSGAREMQLGMRPSCGADVCIAILAQKKPDDLGQVVEIKLRRCEAPGQRLFGMRLRLICVESSLPAASHGRVLIDTHNDLRLAVDALSGGFEPAR